MTHTHIIQLRLFLILMLLGLVMSCVSSPEFNSSGVDKSLTPQSVIAEPAQNIGKLALWGGTILDSRNLKNATQIEVLAYPLDSSQRPLRDKKPLGRFIISHPGYLELASYPQGRLISVLGIVGDSQKGKVGEIQYIYPVIRAQQLHLWPLNDERRQSGFHFGIGIQM